QLLIADVVGLVNKHTPGTPVSSGHDDFLFRAMRAHANTTESIGAFILLTGFAILMQGDPFWVNFSSWLFVGARLVHMLVYYLNISIVRSLAFGMSIFALLGLFLIGIVQAL
ncbi:MAG: MAPEG family protein, partial [Pseudomonadota bacterium]